MVNREHSQLWFLVWKYVLLGTYSGVHLTR